jgi:YidC/Oxa1 family membrane protein insertase
MGFLGNLFNLFIYQPLYNALIGLYNIIPDLGLAIIILTVIIRIALLPLSKKSIESQKKMQEVQPELKKIQEKYKNDRTMQSQKLMEFYREKKINPASGCMPLIIQLVVLIALYQVFIAGINFDGHSEMLYSFIKNPESINPISLGFLDMSKRNMFLAVIAAGLQFWQTKMIMSKKKKEEKPKDKQNDTQKEPDFATIMQQQMLFVGPLLTLVIGFQFPAGLPLYWIITTLFMIGQQYLILKKDKQAQNNS